MPVPKHTGLGPTLVQTMAGIWRVCEFLRKRLYMMVPEVPSSSTSKMMQSGLQL